MALLDRGCDMSDIIFDEWMWAKEYVDFKTVVEERMSDKDREITKLISLLEEGCVSDTNKITDTIRKITQTGYRKRLMELTATDDLDALKQQYPYWKVIGKSRPNLGLKGMFLDIGFDQECLERVKDTLKVADIIRELITETQSIKGNVSLPGKIVDYRTFLEIAHYGTHIFYGVAVSKKAHELIDLLDNKMFLHLSDFMMYGLSNLVDDLPNLSFVSMHGFRFLEMSMTDKKLYLPRTRIKYTNLGEDNYRCDICESPHAYLLTDQELIRYRCDDHLKYKLPEGRY